MTEFAGSNLVYSNIYVYMYIYVTSLDTCVKSESFRASEGGQF